jgi:hypothetical protein
MLFNFALVADGENVHRRVIAGSSVDFSKGYDTNFPNVQGEGPLYPFKSFFRASIRFRPILLLQVVSTRVNFSLTGEA